MRNSKPSVCRQMRACVYSHFSAWLHSPRTLVMGIMILCFAYMHARSYGHTLSMRGYAAHLGEMVFSYLYNGFNIVMTSTFLLIMVSEIPKRIAFQNTMLIRITRKKWVISLILFCVVVVVLMLAFMTIFCTILSLPYITPGGGWSDLERLAENPDYQYEIPLIREYVRVLSPLQACICAASVVFFFWLTMLLVILLFSLFGQPNLGLLVYMFILEFALTFRFEMVPNMRTPIHFATLVAIGNQFPGKELVSLPLVLSAYILIDAGIIATMMIKARHLDFCFSEKE